MITRLAGILESLDALDATVRGSDGALAYAVMLPAYYAERLRQSDAIGKAVTLFTVHYLESQGQGSSYIPRLIGFPSAEDRRFFELLTTVEGMGNKKALRTLAEQPATIARIIAEQDKAGLTGLPEIGKKTAEKIILELREKVAPFLIGMTETGKRSSAAASIEHGSAPPAVREAIAALVALGESASVAEGMVARAMKDKPDLNTSDRILAAVYGAPGS